MTLTADETLNFVAFFVLDSLCIGSFTSYMQQTNPVSSLMIGILTTVLLQSSSSVVAIIVVLEEARTISVSAGIFMVR